MQITGQVLVLDAAHLTAESAFWAALLGGAVAAREDWHSMIVDAAHVEVTPAGARLLRAVDDADEHGGFRVYAHPVGHPFCLCWGPPPLGERPAAPIGGR